MYIWTVELEEMWDTDGYFSEGAERYTVSAKSYEQALEKARKVALKKSFVDDEESGDGLTHRVTDVRMISIRRGGELDA